LSSKDPDRNAVSPQVSNDRQRSVIRVHNDGANRKDINRFAEWAFHGLSRGARADGSLQMFFHAACL
jgi:hypothetical protein